MMNWKKLAVAALVTIVAMSAQAAGVKFGAICYHNVIDESAPSSKDSMIQRKYFPDTITVQKLIEQFNWYKAQGYTPVSMQQIEDARNGKGKLPEKPILLTFDDGYKSFYELVYPLLKAYHYPAVFAVVTRWLNTPEDQLVDYGDTTLSRKMFVTWAQIREMQNSGLVEIASHTDDLHHSMKGNAQGSLFAAALSGEYKNGRYESEAEYKARIQADFQRSSDSIYRNTGKRPKILVWPYGQHNETARQIARRVGLKYDFTLNDKQLNQASNDHFGRELITQESGLDFVSSYLKGQIYTPKAQRVVHVDLDYVYDSNPKQMAKNIDKLVQRMADYGISTVYLQAYSDSDGDGVADALYFPNHSLPMKADLFGRVAWQLMTRAQVKVYAWMPMMAFKLGNDHQYIQNNQTGKPDPSHYLRLSPYNANNRRIVEGIYRDLAFYNRFNGILFHDDGFLTDFESQDGRNTRNLQQAAEKTDDLIRYSDGLKNAVLEYSFNGKDNLETARNLYASVVNDPEAEKWMAQNLRKFTQHYDYTAIMAMPYLENKNIAAKQTNAWISKLVSAVKSSHVPLDKTVFELQTVNWNNKQNIANRELIGWIETLKKNGVDNIGYYPDDFIKNHPNASSLHRHFSIRR